MGLIRSGTVSSATVGTPRRPLWQRIAQALDRFMAQRSRRVVSAVVLHRSKYDIDRCHRLVLEGAHADGAAKK
jgi:hypothetical protein